MHASSGITTTQTPSNASVKTKLNPALMNRFNALASTLQEGFKSLSERRVGITDIKGKLEALLKENGSNLKTEIEAINHMRDNANSYKVSPEDGQKYFDLQYGVTDPDPQSDAANLQRILAFMREFKRFPSDIKEDPAVEKRFVNPKFILAWYQIERSPKDITELDLSVSGLIRLPRNLETLTKLTELNLRSNQLTALPDWMRTLTALTELDLSCNKFSTLPDWIGELTKLRILHLYGNQLTALPESIGQLKALTKSVLSYNQLTELPASFRELKALRELKLSYNRLTTLPAGFGALTNLRILDLSGNRLTALPPEIAALTALTTLYLSHNQLTTLPAGFGALTNLTELDLSGNQLTALPVELGELTKLRILYLSDNLIAKNLKAIKALQKSLPNTWISL